jgi:hypothetical protein
MRKNRRPVVISEEGRIEEDARLAPLKALAHVLDKAFTIPGTRFRFGLDAVLGLFPGLGDVAGALAGGYSLIIARELGAPSSIQLRMLMNLTIDALVGIVPLAGDLFDFAFKAHSRNLALLQQWLSTPHRTQRSSALVLVAAFVVLAGILAGAGWVMSRAIAWVIGLF